MQELTYLSGYSPKVLDQVHGLIAGGKLGDVLLRKYPAPYGITTDRALYEYTMGLKNRYLRSSPPLSKVVYDFRIEAVHGALGLHSFVSRVQGTRLKAKNEIRVSTLFRDGPEEFLRMIVVHELAHLKEKEHDRAFYRLAEHMEPAYHQLEFDARLYLTRVELEGPLYVPAADPRRPPAGGCETACRTKTDGDRE
ncbi:MAG TPA: YgjP-like metallopeptidase domain-containing protein [Verrucomicrobiae bacterium]|nr:YgjP-like metallopeptidase domain-containing protein [Verrucomicrobiae bacterium]